MGIYQIDMQNAEEVYVDRYPTPQELWDATYTEKSEWRERFADVTFEDKGGTWEGVIISIMPLTK